MLFSLQIPPGLMKSGTRLQAAGRWFTATLIRFAEGAVRPLGGWQELTASAQTDVDHAEVLAVANSAIAAYSTSTSAYTFADVGLTGTVTFEPGSGGWGAIGSDFRVQCRSTGNANGPFDTTGEYNFFRVVSNGFQSWDFWFYYNANGGTPTVLSTATYSPAPSTSDSGSHTWECTLDDGDFSFYFDGTLRLSGTFTDDPAHPFLVGGAIRLAIHEDPADHNPANGFYSSANTSIVTEIRSPVITLDGCPRSILGWRGNDGSSSIGIGTNTKWYAHWLGSLYDITPSGFVPGTVSAAVGSGGDSWGDGNWGDGVWGGLNPSQVSLDPPAVWHQDNWGDYLVGCCSPNDGKIYYWDRSPATIGLVMTNAPTACQGLVVTPERFMVALSPNGEVRTVQWASQESLTDWSGLGATATVILTSDTVIPADGDTVTIGSQTYTLKTTLTPTAGQVLINGSAANVLTNLKSAVNLTGTPGTDYAAATTTNTLVTATTKTATTLVFEARTTGAAGNAVPSTETSAHLSFPTVTLTGGVDVGTAGNFVLEGKGSLVAGRRGKDETLLWTTNELHSMRYIGGVLVYGFSRMGDGCGLIAPGAVAQPDTKSLWMGMRGFFLYDGYVQALQSEVSDYVFSDFNRTQAGKVTAYLRAQFGEVTWHYPSSASDENDRYVTFNYRENHWTVGMLERTAGCDAGALDFPVCGASNGKLYEHENTFSHLDTDGVTALVPTLEAGPVQLGDGDRILAVSQLIPDEQNPVGVPSPNLGNVALSLYTSFYPGEDEVLHGPFTVNKLTDARFSGRWVRPELTEVVAGDWRFGVLRVDGSPAGRR